MKPADAPWAARQHGRLMENSTFALFGEGFLESIYGEFARSRHGVAFVLEEEGAPRGVIASVDDRRAFLRGLAFRSGVRLGWHAALGFIFRAPCRRLLLQTGRYLKNTGRPGSGAEMIFITVAPETRGQGAARRLIIATLEEFRRRGVRETGVSIESDNRPVRKVLLGLGFRLEGTFVFADKGNDFLRFDLACFEDSGKKER